MAHTDNPTRRPTSNILPFMVIGLSLIMGAAAILGPMPDTKLGSASHRPMEQASIAPASFGPTGV